MDNSTLVESIGGFFTIREWASNYLPQIVIALALLFAGFLIGDLLKKGIIKLGEITGFNRISKSTTNILQRFGYRKSTIEFIGELAKWIVFLFFVGAAIQYGFGEQILTQTLGAIANYFPKVVLAVIIIVIGLVLSDILGNMASGLVKNLFPKLKDKNLISFFSGGITKVLVFLIGVIIALDVLGIYVDVLTIGFAVIFFSVTLIVIVGSRDFLLNAFSGIYIQSVSSLRKGTEIEFENKKGRIKEIGLIHTILEMDKKEVHIPNHLFMKKICTVK